MGLISLRPDKTLGGGRGGCAKIFSALEKNVGGGGYAVIFYGREKML